MTEIVTPMLEPIVFPALKHPPRVYTELTPSSIKVLRLYLDIVKERSRNGFRRSLETTAEALGLSRRAVWNANDCLRQLGFLYWDRGGGNRAVAGAGCFPNEYWLNFERIEQEFGRRVNK